MKQSEVRGPKSERTRGRFRTPEPGPRTVIIGYGNPTRSDDGVGWHASGLLADVFVGQNVEVIACHQLTPELAEALSRCQRAVFIDADARGRPGTIRRREICAGQSSAPAFTHSCTPAGLLASAQELYGRSPEAVIFTVSAQSFAFGESLSSTVSKALRDLVRRVCDWLKASA